MCEPVCVRVSVHSHSPAVCCVYCLSTHIAVIGAPMSCVYCYYGEINLLLVYRYSHSTSRVLQLSVRGTLLSQCSAFFTLST